MTPGCAKVGAEQHVDHACAKRTGSADVDTQLSPDAARCAVRGDDVARFEMSHRSGAGVFHDGRDAAIAWVQVAQRAAMDHARTAGAGGVEQHGIESILRAGDAALRAERLRGIADGGGRGSRATWQAGGDQRLGAHTSGTGVGRVAGGAHAIG